MNLSIFNTTNLFEAATQLFQSLGIKLNSNTAEPLPIKDLLKQHYKENDTFKSIGKTYFIGIIDNTVFQATGMFDVNYSYKEALQQGDKNYDGLMLFALELSKQPTRTEISDLTRTFNRISQKMPVALVLKYKTGDEACFSIAISERFKYKQNWRQGEKAGKVIILRDIHTITTHAGHERILLDLVKPVSVTNYDQLHQHWLQVLDVNILNKKFFQDLANWYFWAMDNVSFPDDLEKKKDVRNATNLIRLITRVVFIWFIKEKSLVPNALFNKSHLDKILKDFNKNKKSQNYYHAILQNLFFGTLNQKMNERKFAKDGGNIKTNGEEYGVKNLFRYADLFTISEKEAMQLFKDVPFLNGGLFDCLDKPDEEGKIVYVDGFSRNPKKQAVVPDYIFFGEEREVDLNDIFATKNKKYKSRGLINLLESYKFTVAENTPIEEEIALDPELLGKVFENLLASYNPETKTTARKQTGSFYTPREIVNYMVDESLLEYIKQNVKNNDSDFETRLRELISYAETPNPFDEAETKALIEAINNCKILDPACGSGAYPMGILHKMVHLLQKLDPENKYWKDLQRQKAMEETDAAFKIGDKEERGKRLAEINDVFENNASDYGRKLYLIENCIYGIDIQPIAVQISKLRFFISLIIDQNKQASKENFGIRSLPNLETKFVAANTLIGLDIPTNDLFAENNPIKKLENDLKSVRHEYFAASNRKEKLRLQKEDKKLRKQISELIKDQLIKKGDSDIVELKQLIQDENRNLKQLEKSKEDFEIIKTTDIFGAITQTKIDKRAKKIKAQMDRISHFEKELQTKELATNKDSIANVAEQIASFDPYDQNTFAPWFDPEWMFGLTTGFDIVIGNPPYGNLFKEKDYFNYIKNHYKTAEYKIDSYAVFTEKGTEVCKKNGIVSFIIPYTFISGIYFSKFREFINSNSLQTLIVLGKKIFQAADVDTCILLLNKKQKGKEINLADFRLENGLEKISDFKTETIPYELVMHNYKELICVGSVKQIETYTQIIRNKKRLSDYLTFYHGIQSRGNENAIVFTKKKGTYPLLKGRDFNKYTFDIEEKYFVFTEDNIKSGGNLDFHHTDKKIIIRTTADSIIATIDYNKYLVLNSVNIGILKEKKIELEEILALLNSTLMKFWYDMTVQEPGKTFAEVKIVYLERLPVISLGTDCKKLVLYLLFLNDSESEYFQFITRLIDAIVYELYLPEEIKAGGAEVLKHLGNLPELKEGQEEKNLKTIEKVYKELSDPKHPISAALLKLLTIEEVNIIEGRK